MAVVSLQKQPGGGEGDRLRRANPAYIPPPRRRFSHADREEFPGKSGTRADVLSGLMASVWNGADPEHLAENHRRPAKAGAQGAHFTLSLRGPLPLPPKGRS